MPDRPCLFDRLAAAAAHHAGRPIAQLCFVAFCVAWLVLGLGEERLTLALSVLAITLTQMVLGYQSAREREDRRRDVALHAKMDELIRATTGARDDLAHLEDQAEDEIERLRS